MVILFPLASFLLALVLMLFLISNHFIVATLKSNAAPASALQTLEARWPKKI